MAEGRDTDDFAEVVEQSSEGGSIPSGWPGVGGKPATQAAPHSLQSGSSGGAS